MTSPETTSLDWETARATFTQVIQHLPDKGNIVILHDVDADGIAAGVVFQCVLERLKFQNVVRLMPNRERNAWMEANRQIVAAHQPAFLFVLDLGSQSHKVLEGVPTCFIDHHKPEGVPDGDVLISGYEWEPIPNTSWMVYELAREMAPIEDLDWIAVIGTLSDLGEKAPWPFVDETKKKYTAKWLKEATALVNAPRRSSVFDPESAAQALLQFDNPKSLCESDNEIVQRLKTARAEVTQALNEGKKAAPKFAGDVALITVDSPCQIHPLIAQIWRSRLPKYHVLCANYGYMPGRVNFSGRSGGGKSVRELLRGIELSPGEGAFGHGHDQASGGSLSMERWEELLEKLGFAPQTVKP